MAFFGHGTNHDFLNLPMVFQIIRDNHLQWPLAGLLASHLISFGYDYLWCGEFRRTDLMTLMNQPYRRVIMMHLTIIFGGFLMMLLKSPVAGLAFLVCLKIIFDLRGHQKEREKFTGTEDKIVPEATASRVETSPPVLEIPSPVQSAIEARMKLASNSSETLQGKKVVVGIVIFALLFFGVFGSTLSKSIWFGEKGRDQPSRNLIWSATR